MTQEAPSRILLAPLIDAALAEDVGSGDVTTEATVAADHRASAGLLVKEEGVLCGLTVAEAVFHRLDPAVRFEPDAVDGDPVTPGTVVARLRGPARGILTGERVALNFLQHLSGIATATRRAVTAVGDHPTTVLDTRKTIPALRYLAKYAVRCGGGGNHRLGLYDMILIKENHIVASGGITTAVRRARAARPDLALEVEVTSLAELEEALAAGPDRVMLDNFTPDRVREAMDHLRAWEAKTGKRRPEVELSGGITPETIPAFAATGADFISTGAITHSAPSLDVSLEFDLEDGS